jgi:glutamyl-tRNA reductase
VSLGYAVVELAKSIFGDLAQRSAVLLGAGEIARAVARDLCERGVGELQVANRNPERGERFVAEFPGARFIPFAERIEAVAQADLVIASTGADEPVLTKKQLEEAMSGRSTRPLLVVDLGVPRNVEPEARRIENLFLHPIDSLDHLIQRNLKRRKEEVPKVEEILDQELGRFRTWYRSLEAEPLIARLQKQAEAIRRQEVAAVLLHFPAETHDSLERLTRALVRKILHHPSARLRAKDAARSLPHLDLVRELFHLDDDEPG